jgi:uncharacterized membrane protein
MHRRPMTASSDSRLPRLTHQQVVALIAIVVIAAFLRFYQISSASLWMDEIWTMEMCAGRGSVHDHLPQNIIETAHPNYTEISHAAPWSHIWSHFDGYPHPPLFYLLLRLWMDLFGNSPLVARSLPAIFSLASVAVFFDLVRIIASPRHALFAAAIMACSIAQIDTAQDARNYSMALLLVLAAADALVRIEQLGPNRIRLIALAGFSFASLLTHYFAAPALLALFLYAAIRLRSRARIASLASLVLGAIVFLAVWGYWMQRQLHALPPGTPSYLDAGEGPIVIPTLFRIVGLPARFLLGDSLARKLPAITIIFIAVLIYLLPIFRLRSHRQWLLWLLLLATVIGCCVLIDLSKRAVTLDFLRYTILASPSAYAIVAALQSTRRKRLADVVLILTVGLLFVLACERSFRPVKPKEDWRQLAGDLDTASNPDDLLVFTNRDFYISPGTWYVGLRYYTPSFHHPWLILNYPPSPDLLRTLRSHNHLWLIGMHPQADAPELLPGFQPQAVITTSAGSACLLVSN